MGGYELGVQQAEQDRAIQQAHKQSLSDKELEQKATELVYNRKAIQQKLPTLLDENNQPTPEYHQAISDLTKNAQDLRELYHPQKNPGAIEKVGHILTDHLHITNPQEREQQQNTKQAALAAGDQAEAERVAASAAPSPEQQVQTSNAAMFASIQGALQNYDKLNPHASGTDATPEEKQARESFRNDIIQKAMGLAQHPNWKRFKLPGKENFQYFDVNRPDTIPPGASAEGAESADQRKRADYEQAKKVFEENNPGKTFPSFEKWGATESQKPSTSAINEGREDYAVSHGFKTWDDIPEEYRDVAMNYEIRKQALDKQFPSSTTSTRVMANFAGQMVPVTETSYKTPAGDVVLRDPLWFLAKPMKGPSGGTQQSGKGAPRSGQQRKAKQSGDASGSSSKDSGNVKVGQPLFSGPNKSYRDQQDAVNNAVKRDKKMHDNLKEALKSPPDQQAMLSLVANHIGMTLGAQKGARINQAVWNEAVASRAWLAGAQAKFDPHTGYLSGVTLTPEQMRQMVNLADESLKVEKESLDDMTKQANKGVKYPSSGSGSQPSSPSQPPKGATHKKKYQGKWYYTDDKGNNLGELPQ